MNSITRARKHEEKDLLRLESYDYFLPEDRIAQFPVTPRDVSKLLFVSRDGGRLSDYSFRDFPEILKPGDLLVINNTRVIPARLQSSAGEVLLIRPTQDKCWDALVHPGKHFKPGERIEFSDGSMAEVLSQSPSGRILRFNRPVEELLNALGQVPLPPYIRREPDNSDRSRYQTVYATRPGSIAAPTAGLHFTRAIFKRLANRGVSIARITLHVGPGTFRPVKQEDITRHYIDPEYYKCSNATWERIADAARVIAVGTTTVRAVETISRTGELEGFSHLFIYPGYSFRRIGGLVTNFHLPKSSLLMLVSAFGGYELVRSAYNHAIVSGYRFYSYGDAMVIL